MKGIGKYIFFVLGLLLCANTVFAQKAERKNVRKGNSLYKNEKYTEAEVSYRKSLEVNPRSLEGTFNLGNALYKQEKYPEAAEQYQLLIGQAERMLQENPANMEKLAGVFHNLGNISMKNKDYAQSIEAYKQSLRMNPGDDETRYNLALAQKLLEDEEGDGGDDGEGEDENEDQENQDDQQDQNQDQDDSQQDQQDNQNDQDQQQSDDQMSQENAQQILDAFLQDEKDTQEKVQKAQQQQMERRRTDKEW